MSSLSNVKTRNKRRLPREPYVSKRVLFTTAYESRPYDYIKSNAPENDGPRLQYERRISYGLRFLQANVPGIEILEYPTRSEYLQAIRIGWDVIGFSFYTNEIPVIRDMVSAARAGTAAELWCGNYGALTPEAAALFDRVAVGYAEAQVAEWLGVRLGDFIHPTLIVPLELGKGLGLVPMAVLFTTRGCDRACTFCQTPVFCGKRIDTISIDSLAEVIRTYKQLRVGGVLILDENFGSAAEHAEKVASLLNEAAIPWLPMTRADILASRLPEWGPQGLAGVLLGIESFSDASLRRIRKGGNGDLAKALIRRLRAQDRLVIGFYMIGFEDDTRESLENDLQELAALKLDVTQACILTPFHQTPLWGHLSDYGIDERDLSKFDGKHLVWAHPNFSAAELEEILRDFFLKTFPRERDSQMIRRFGRQLMRRVGIGAALSFLAGTFLRSNVKNT